jgi:hypothetical protein
MNGKDAKPKRLKDDPAAREDLVGKLDRYLDVPLALASLALVLIAIIELTGEVSGPWQGRLAALGWALWSLFLVEFVVKLVLAPIRRRYLREHWLDALIVLLPFLRVLRLARVVQTARGLPAFRLLVFGGEGLAAHPRAPQATPDRPARHHLRDGHPHRYHPGVPPGDRSPRGQNPGLRRFPVVVGGPRHHGQK